ncbi:hypothetical protein DPMN_090281, partial [Dreissena polymorpha]
MVNTIDNNRHITKVTSCLFSDMFQYVFIYTTFKNRYNAMAASVTMITPVLLLLLDDDDDDDDDDDYYYYNEEEEV